MKIFALLTLLNFSAPQDSLVLFSDLQFNSNFEKQQFLGLQNNELDMFAFFSSISPGTDEQVVDLNANRVTQVVSELNSGNILEKKPAKKIKSIYTIVHDTFFAKYVLENRFTDIFTDGYYNCVSASALYAIVFEELGIDYVIKETPRHVYLVAYPEQEDILVETTNPIDGYLEFNVQFKKEYLDRLRQLKLIGASEFASMSTNELFNKYYFKDDEIDLIELVGIQYYNAGISALQNEDYEEAWIQFQKSYYLYQHDRTAYLLITSGSLRLKEIRPTDKSYAQYVLGLSRFSDYGIDREMITNEFVMITNTLLFERSEVDNYQNTYDFFTEQIKNDTLRRDIDFIYYYETGRYYLNNGQVTKALKNVETAYNIKPKNTQAQTFFVAVIGEKLSRNSSNIEVSESLFAYGAKYPELVSNSNFETMRLSSMLIASSDMFYQRKEITAQSFLDQFETAYDKDNSDLGVESGLIGRAYTSAAMFYFRKGYKTKAKQLINTGLGLVPGNSSLTQLLAMIK